jgi:DNA-binding NarL/FixJ family response regulator
MFRYGYGHQDYTRRQRSRCARQGNGPAIDSPRHSSRPLRGGQTRTRAFIPLTEQEAAVVRLLALGHTFETIVERFQCEPAEVERLLSSLAERVSGEPT